MHPRSPPRVSARGLVVLVCMFCFLFVFLVCCFVATHRAVFVCRNTGLDNCCNALVYRRAAVPIVVFTDPSLWLFSCSVACTPVSPCAVSPEVSPLRFRSRSYSFPSAIATVSAHTVVSEVTPVCFMQCIYRSSMRCICVDSCCRLPRCCTRGLPRVHQPLTPHFLCWRRFCRDPCSCTRDHSREP